MSHNLKTVSSSNECDRVRVSTYCGPAAGGPDRSRMQLTQTMTSQSMNLTKAQAAALGKQMLEWSKS